MMTTTLAVSIVALLVSIWAAWTAHKALRLNAKDHLPKLTLCFYKTSVVSNGNTKLYLKLINKGLKPVTINQAQFFIGKNNGQFIKCFQTTLAVNDCVTEKHTISGALNDNAGVYLWIDEQRMTIPLVEKVV